ncbi:MAG: class I SAM-dependent methyltransferase [Nannocystaceae bacterium]
MPPERTDVIALYQRHAAAYDAMRSRSLFERAWLGRFLELAATCQTGAGPLAILDLGCGAGEPIARHLIDRGCAVTGVDAAAPMIERCRQRFPAHTWLVADMRDLTPDALDRRRFAGILAWDSLFHLSRDDQRRVLVRLRDFAAPGAALLFTSGSEDGEAVGELCGEPLYHASLATEDYRRRLDAAGFTPRAHVITDPSCGEHTVWLAQRRAED